MNSWILFTDGIRKRVQVQHFQELIEVQPALIVYVYNFPWALEVFHAGAWGHNLDQIPNVVLRERFGLLGVPIFNALWQLLFEASMQVLEQFWRFSMNNCQLLNWHL